MVPVQITDGHQRKRWAAIRLRGPIYLLAFIREGVEVGDGGFWFDAWKNGYGFAANCKRLHIGSSTFCIGNYYPLKFVLFYSLYSKETAGTTGVKRTYSSAVNKLRIVRTHDFLAYLC